MQISRGCGYVFHIRALAALICVSPSLAILAGNKI
nr:MAG TPA: hypothetical protein [Bacteriophage sp.]